jgi:uncharacterized repeat protein (TIGR02543 family)
MNFKLRGQKQIRYNVRFDKNGTGVISLGTMKNQSFTYGRLQSLSGNSFRRPGFRFNGWNTRKDGRGKSFRNRQMVQTLTSRNGRTVTLYAQWRRVK